MKPFKDILDHTFESYIIDLHCKGIIAGYEDGTYRPDQNVTRGEMAKIVIEAFDIPYDTEGENFPDVGDGHTFYKYIQTLHAKGVVNGYSDGLYRSDEFVDRGQVTKFITLAMKEKGIEIDLTRTESFIDVNTSNVFISYIAFLSNYTVGDEAIIQGYGDGKFDPFGATTRGAIAKITSLSSREFTISELRTFATDEVNQTNFELDNNQYSEKEAVSQYIKLISIVGSVIIIGAYRIYRYFIKNRTVKNRHKMTKRGKTQ